MVQLRTLLGNNAGALQVIRRFPCVLGRSATADMRLEEPGVWDRHLELQFNAGEGYSAAVLPGALATINGQKFERGVLRNGDVIEFGAAKLQFWLAPTRQQSLVWRERLTWAGLGALCAVQIAIIYYLLR